MDSLGELVEVGVAFAGVVAGFFWCEEDEDAVADGAVVAVDVEEEIVFGFEEEPSVRIVVDYLHLGPIMDMMAVGKWSLRTGPRTI